MTVTEIVQAFQDNPSLLKSSYERLQKKFNTDKKDIQCAKDIVRMKIQGHPEAEQKLKDFYQSVDSAKTEYISLKEFGEMIGIEMKKESDKIYQNNPGFVKGTGIEEEEWNEEMLDETNTIPMIETNWIEKEKWIKTKDGSTHLVNADYIEPEGVNFKQEFQEFIDSYKVPKMPVYDTENNKVLLVYMADKHIGAQTKENSLFKNEYNESVYSDRMLTLAKEIIQLDKKNSFDKIILIDLGDSVDGFNSHTTRGGHQLPQNMTNREVYKTFLNSHMDFIGIVYNNCTCRDLSYITVGESNHGGDFEWICNKSLETVLNLTYPHIQTAIGNKFVEHIILGQHCFILCHGKDIEDLKYPLPKNLNNKTEIWIKSYIDQMNITSKYIHFIKGDLHQASSEYSSFFRYKNVLSLYGSSKWAQTNFMQNTKGVCMDILSECSITEHYLFL